MNPRVVREPAAKPESLLVQKKDRKKNAGTEWGQLEIKPARSSEDYAEFDTITVNKALDITLVRALAARGYDTRIREVEPKESERRVRYYMKRDARLAREALLAKKAQAKS